MMLDLEHGLNVQIPKAFSQSHMPYSFRFYDPLVAIV